MDSDPCYPWCFIGLITVEFLPVGHSSRSLGASELLQKVSSTRSHALETLETTQNLIQKLLRGFSGTKSYPLKTTTFWRLRKIVIGRNYHIRNVVQFEGSSILPLPGWLEPSGWQFLKVEGFRKLLLRNTRFSQNAVPMEMLNKNEVRSVRKYWSASGWNNLE